MDTITIYNELMNSEEHAEMRAYWPFTDLDSFDHLFGMRNGTRMNKILLAFITSKAVFERMHSLASTNSMQEMKRLCFSVLTTFDGDLRLMRKGFSLPGYRTDSYNGICQDGDTNSVRFVHDGKVAKMRAGKLFQKIIRNNGFGKILPDQVVTWLCEEFASAWNAYSLEHSEKGYRLLTGLDGNLTFADIYNNGSYSAGYFDSCMSGKGRHAFFDKSLKDCYPAALVKENDPNTIVCRCVVYNHVVDTETGEVLRLAERQYTCEDDATKRVLVNKLINAGLIDGYKVVGASCHDSWNFVLNDGTSLKSRKLSVCVNFFDNKVLSYQDSFKWYDNDAHKAYNFAPSKYSLDLATTSERVLIHLDSYHNKEIFRNPIGVWVGGKRMTCDPYDDGDFIRWNADYFHREKDTTRCPHCGSLMGAHHIPAHLTSEPLGKSYCSNSCRNAEESKVFETKMFYSVYDETYVRKASELTLVFVNCESYRNGRWKRGYRKISIKKTTLEALVLLGLSLKYKGEFYIGFSMSEQKPFLDLEGKIKMLP